MAGNRLYFTFIIMTYHSNLRMKGNSIMLNLNSIMLGSEDSEKLGEFYKKVLQKEPDMVEDGWYGFSCGSCFLTIGNHDKVKGQSNNPERIILNFETNEVKEEFDRIKSLGATVVKEPYSMGEEGSTADIATFADPDGNYFQLMTPWEGNK
jgi:predicted enzyme related to lactoylglutathione lyase